MSRQAYGGGGATAHLVRNKSLECARFCGHVAVAVDGVEQEVTRLTKGVRTTETRYQLEARVIAPNGISLSVMSERVRPHATENGMRNIRDYKARIRPERETLGSASPINVITEAMTLRTFTLDEVRELYRQHTDATGQVFEPGCAEQAFAYSGGQPYLVNALARWCVDKIHDRRYGETVTLADIHEAKEKIIRERGTHLDSLLERMQEPRARRIVEPVLLGDDGLDMQGLLLAFQDFWRENAGLHPAPFGYVESYPHIVLQAFLQRVISGGGEIIREMALGSGRLDLGVLFRGGKYAVEVKLKKNYEKNRERAYDQVCRYMDHLGQSKGWLVVFDPDPAVGWDVKLTHEDIAHVGKVIHLFRC